MPNSLPVFGYIDFIPDRDIDSSKEAKLKMAHQVYVFCKINKTNKFLFRNLVSGFESEVEVNINGLGKILKKEGMIN